MSTPVISRASQDERLLNVCNLLTQEQEREKLEEGGIAETAMKKAAESVVKWYPPLIVERNPQIGLILGILYPPLGRVLEISRSFYNFVKNLFPCR